MFKKALHLLPLFAMALFIGLCSCNSRKSKNDLLKESVVKYKDSVKPIEIATYFPKKNVLREIDTVLSTGFKFRISSSVDMENAIVKSVSHDTVVENQCYRKSIVNLKVFSDDKLIFDHQIDTSFINNYEGFSEKFERGDLIISDLWLDPKTHLNTNGDKIFFKIKAFNPNKKLDTRINLHINETGTFTMHSTKSYPINS